MRFWICQKCSRLFWSERRACDRCGGELLPFQNANAELYIKTLGFSQVGVPELSALEESLDSLFERTKEKDRQAQKDTQEVLEKSSRKQYDTQAPETKRPHREGTSPEMTRPHREETSSETTRSRRENTSDEMIAQQQKERDEHRKKTEEKRKKILEGRGEQGNNSADRDKQEREGAADRSSVRKTADHQSSEVKISRPAPQSPPRTGRRSAGVRESLSKLGLRKKGISVE